MSKELSTLETFKKNLYATQRKAISNYLNGDQKRVLRFLASVGTAIERTPGLLDCDQSSVMQAFVNAAMLDLDPSGISGECYVLPYKGKGQFQMGYKGLVTLMYRNGIQKITSEIVRENDKVSLINGELKHEIDPFKSMEDRGKRVGAYVIVKNNDEETVKFMNGKDILAHGKKFSKSFSSEYSPWNEKNDPEGWQWKKTVLIQGSKLLPLGDSLKKAINLDYQDSVIYDRMEKAKVESAPLQLGHLNKHENKENKNNKEETEPASESNEA